MTQRRTRARALSPAGSNTPPAQRPSTEGQVVPIDDLLPEVPEGVVRNPVAPSEVWAAIDLQRAEFAKARGETENKDLWEAMKTDAGHRAVETLLAENRALARRVRVLEALLEAAEGESQDKESSTRVEGKKGGLKRSAKYEPVRHWIDKWYAVLKSDSRRKLSTTKLALLIDDERRNDKSGWEQLTQGVEIADPSRYILDRVRLLLKQRGAPTQEK